MRKRHHPFYTHFLKTNINDDLYPGKHSQITQNHFKASSRVRIHVNISNREKWLEESLKARRRRKTLNLR